MLNRGYVRNYASTIRLLAERGHSVHVVFTNLVKQADDRLAETLAAEYSSVSVGSAPRRADTWSGLAWSIRASLDYLRYFHPSYRDADRLRERAFGKLMKPLRLLFGLLHLSFIRGAAGRGLVKHCLMLLERAVPTSRAIDRFVRSDRPDVVLVTPLVDVGSAQIDFLKSARVLGIRTGLCVASWDNLTNKGLIRVTPDVVIVWNEIQRQEAVELHGVPPSRIVVSGAQHFDEWFELQPSTTRQAFCERAGLRADRPFLLYVCSSPFIAPSEVPFVRTWLERLRTSGREDLATAGILIRPHPQNAAQWEGVRLGHDGVAIWPREGAFPVDADSKADYFDSLYHSAGVVGINTSALIEAAIVGRPVHTVLVPEFDSTQRGTLHFHYLLHKNGGPLRVAETWEEHLAQLSRTLAGVAIDRRAVLRWVESFVRPRGLDRPCTPLVAAAIEGLARLGPATPERAPAWIYPLRAALFPLALVGNKVWNIRKAIIQEREQQERERQEALRARGSGSNGRVGQAGLEGAGSRAVAGAEPKLGQVGVER